MDDIDVQHIDTAISFELRIQFNKKLKSTKNYQMDVWHCWVKSLFTGLESGLTVYASLVGRNLAKQCEMEKPPRYFFKEPFSKVRRNLGENTEGVCVSVRCVHIEWDTIKMRYCCGNRCVWIQMAMKPCSSTIVVMCFSTSCDLLKIVFSIFKWLLY